MKHLLVLLCILLFAAASPALACDDIEQSQWLGMEWGFEYGEWKDGENSGFSMVGSLGHSMGQCMSGSGGTMSQGQEACGSYDLHTDILDVQLQSSGWQFQSSQ